MPDPGPASSPAGGSALALAAAQVAVTLIAPTCMVKEQNRLADRALAASPEDQPKALAELESCGERIRRANRYQWIVTGVGVAGLVVTAAAAYGSLHGSDTDYLFDTLPVLMLALPIVTGLSVPTEGMGIAGQFLERARDAGLALNGTPLPNGGAMVGLSGRF